MNFDRRRSRALTALLALVLTVTAAGAVPPASRAAVEVTHGYQDMSFSAASVTTQSLTSDTVQSKLWVQDGFWWGVLFKNSDAKHHIFRMNNATQSWTDTGVILDDRDGGKGDVLVAGTTLYVAFSENTAAIRFYRLQYNTASDTYVLDVGFPKTLETRNAAEVAAAAPVGSGPATLARDSTGKLWVVFNRANQVRYLTSATGATWSTPARQLPVQGNDMDPLDVAAVTAVGSDGIGILWSNQAVADDAFYFARHADADAEDTWQARETALSMAGGFTSDEQFSLKTTPSGDVLAAVHTRRDNVSPSIPSDPIVALLERSGGGVWTSHTVTNVSTGQVGRPVVVVDGDAAKAEVFLVDPVGGGIVYRRSATLATLNFGASALGTPVIESTADPNVKNPTSSKAATATATGIIVEAEDKSTRRYLHACVGTACPSAIPPIASFTFSPSAPMPGQTITFTDTSVNGPTSWAWDFQNDGVVDSTSQNPTFSYATLGSRIVKLTVTNSAGSTSTTRTVTVADVTGPTITGPYEYFIVPSTLGTLTLPVKITWSATDPSGVVRYRLFMRTGTGAWTAVALASALSRSVIRTLTVNQLYTFRVYAYDARGNSSHQDLPYFRVLRFQQNSSTITYTGAWTTALTASASSGSLKYATAAGASAVFTTFGRGIAWVAWTAATRGRAEVYIDGLLASTIDLRTTTSLPRRVVFNKTWSIPGTHTIKIVVLGTAGRPRVDLDAFLVAR